MRKGMMPACQFKTVAQFIGLLLLCAACASFEPGLKYQDLMRPRHPTVKEEKEGISVSIEEFATSDKSLQVFDADIAPGGVLPLAVKIENNQNSTYRILVEDIRALLGSRRLPALTGTEAANQAATSEYAGKAFLWTVAAGPFAVLLWPSTIAGSATHTRAVNRKVEQHFQRLEFTDALLKPQQTAVGFKYFKLPENIKSLKSLTIEVGLSEVEGDARHVFTLQMPTLDLSAPVSVREAEEESSDQ